MQFFSSAIVGATIFGLLASAVPLEARQDELQPFQVTAVASQSPPGRPGSSPCMLFDSHAQNAIAHDWTQGHGLEPMLPTQTPTSSPKVPNGT